MYVGTYDMPNESFIPVQKCIYISSFLSPQFAFCWRKQEMSLDSDSPLFIILRETGTQNNMAAMAVKKDVR